MSPPLQRFCMVYRSKEGTPVFLSGVREDALREIRRVQEELGSTDFQVVKDGLPWLHPMRELQFELIFENRHRPTWDECLRFIEFNKTTRGLWP